MSEEFVKKAENINIETEMKNCCSDLSTSNVMESISEDEEEEDDDSSIIDNKSSEKVIFEKNDRSLKELYDWYQSVDKDLIIDPEWQREYVWKEERASQLIESLLLDIPIPTIYLAETKEQKYEVIDGLQRLQSVFNFFNNKYKIKKCQTKSIKDQIEGKFFNELDSSIKKKLQKTTIRTFELSKDTAHELKFMIFERLNTGGIALNEMEIRNCLYRGELNDLIKKLTQEEKFKYMTEKFYTNRRAKNRMSDRELVLRFLSFYQMSYAKMKHGFKVFANDFLKTYRNPGEEKLQEYEKAFKKAMSLCFSVFGDRAFRLYVPQKACYKEKLNVALFTLMSVCFAELNINEQKKLSLNSDAVYEAREDLMATTPKFIDACVKNTGDPTNVEFLFQTWNNIIKNILENSENQGVDKQRCFSRSLKESMFKQSQICGICNNKIHTIEDSAIDHINPYCRGGLTVPENARLVHRLCNQMRGGGEIKGYSTL